MKIISQACIAFSFLLFVSCSDADKSNTDTVSDEVEMNSSTEQIAEPSMNNQNQVQDQGQIQNQLMDTSGVALNPPHGEPGHDCAIPVGAPLNSTPQSNSQPIQLNATGTDNATTAEGLNPPHGQPGHDCAIPVGAPLNN